MIILKRKKMLYFHNEQIIDETKIDVNRNQEHHIIHGWNNESIKRDSIVLLKVCLLFKPAKFHVIKQLIL